MRPQTEKAAAALQDPRKRTIVRFARDHAGGTWTLGELYVAHPDIAPVRELNTLCMRLVVAGVLRYVPTDATNLRDQPFRLRAERRAQ